MKITLHIDDQHAHELVSLLANIIAKSSAVEDIADPAPGHPELSLNDMIDAAQAKTDSLTERLDALIEKFSVALDLTDPFATELEDSTPADDGTRRDLPFPDGIIPPPLPEGKTRWIYRGTFMEDDAFYVERPRHIEYFCRNEKRWHLTSHFSTTLHHIEAV